MGFKKFVKKVLSVLEKSKIDYIIVGGLIAIYYGEPRTTQDFDVIIRVSEGDIEKISTLCSLLEREKFRIIGGCESILTSIKERPHAAIYDEDYTFRIDLQGVYSRLNVLAFEGRRRVRIFGVEAWIQGPEDLIVAKLTYYVGNRDIRDVAAILKNSYEVIDWKRMKRLAREFGVEDRIKDLLWRLGLLYQNENTNPRTSGRTP